MATPSSSGGRRATALYRGDAELIIWTRAWVNHAVLDGVRIFSSNLFFPAPGTLRYNEHLFGLSLFTLPWRAAGASPVLAQERPRRLRLAAPLRHE